MELNWLKNLARAYMPVYKYETDTMKIAYAGYSSIKKNYCVRLLLDENNQHTFFRDREPKHPTVTSACYTPDNPR